MQFGYPEQYCLHNLVVLLLRGEKNYRPLMISPMQILNFGIVSEDRNLLNLFEESASFDMIAKQYTTSYAFIQEILCNWAINHQFEYLDAAEFICDLFLQIMARVPDSLIFRKNSQECAEQIRLEAEKIVELGGILTEAGKNQISDFNDRLLAKKGKLNPGTTADLTACAIFLGMCFGQLIILTN